MPKTETKTLRCPLTQEETNHRARDLAKLDQEVEDLEQQLKEVTADYKAKIAEKKNEKKNVGTVLRNGYEYRRIECTVKLNTPRAGLKTYYRADNGQEADVKPMDATEHQGDLFED